MSITTLPVFTILIEPRLPFPAIAPSAKPHFLHFIDILGRRRRGSPNDQLGGQLQMKRRRRILCVQPVEKVTGRHLPQLLHRLRRRGQRRHTRSEEHTSELQSQSNLVCRLLLEKKKKSEIQPQLFRDSLISCRKIVAT